MILLPPYIHSFIDQVLCPKFSNRFIDGMETVIGVQRPLETSKCFVRARNRSVSTNIFRALRAALALSLFHELAHQLKHLKILEGPIL